MREHHVVTDALFSSLSILLVLLLSSIVSAALGYALAIELGFAKIAGDVSIFSGLLGCLIGVTAAFAITRSHCRRRGGVL